MVKIATTGVELDTDSVRIEAGAVWDDVVARTVSAGFGGAIRFVADPREAVPCGMMRGCHAPCTRIAASRK